MLPYSAIQFDATLYLYNVTENVLDEKAQQAVCAAVVETTGIQEDGCEIVSQAADFSWLRRLTTAPSHTIQAVARITSSTGDFADTLNDANGDALYDKIVTLLETAVNSDDFSKTVREKSAEFGAVSTLFVGNVNFTASPYSDPNGVEDDDTQDLTKGEYAGIIVAAIVIAVVSVLLVWWCLCKRGSHQNTAIGPDKAVTTTAAGVQYHHTPQDKGLAVVVTNKDLNVAEV